MAEMTTPAEVRLTEETVTYLEQRMKSVVSDAIKDAITGQTAEAFWAAGFKVLHAQAAKHTGHFVLGGLWGLARRVMVFVLLGWSVYMIGGWSLLAKFWHAARGG